MLGLVSFPVWFPDSGPVRSGARGTSVFGSSPAAGGADPGSVGET
jgi:hypothetical protein